MIQDKAKLYELCIAFSEEIEDQKGVLAYIDKEIKIVFDTPKTKLWKRMDEIFDNCTEEFKFCRVYEYNFEQLAAMLNNAEFDRTDRLDYLTWAIEWYVFHHPGRHSPERQVCLINLSWRRS